MNQSWTNKPILCLGLDTDILKIPIQFSQEERPQFAWNCWLITQTAPFIDAIKINSAFYEVGLASGWQILFDTIKFIRQNYPDLFIILDAKRGDIGNTSEAYASAIYDALGVDAVTLSPYLGREALEPFLRRNDKFAIILCKTSNPGSGEFQDLNVVSLDKDLSLSTSLWQVIAQQVSRDWNINNNCMLVVGATYPEQLRQVRQLVGEMPILVPGVGTQGGDLEQVLSLGLSDSGGGLIIAISRDIILANDPANRAEYWSKQINHRRV